MDYQNQVGPHVQGTGSIFIYTYGKSATVFYSPADETKSKAFYGTNSSKPDIPFPIRTWITIPNVENVTIDYEVIPGGDIKICWSILG